MEKTRKPPIMKRSVVLSIIILSLLLSNAAGQINDATISGSFNVNSTLTGGTTVSPETNNHVDYEWFYSIGTSKGISDTYIIQPEDQGYNIYVLATERKNGSNDFVRSFQSPSTKVNSFPLSTYLSVSGTPRSGMILNGSYVFSDVDNDTESGSLFKWYTGTSPGGANPVEIGSGSSKSFTLSDSQIGLYIGFSVIPGASSGSTPGNKVTTPTWIGPVVANSPPVASSVSVTGSLKVKSVLTGHYTYTDAEGDIEGGSVYQWYSAENLSGLNEIVIGNSIFYQLTNAEIGRYIRFSVTPAANTGNLTGGLVTSAPRVGPVTNDKPVASSVSITGDLKAKSVLTGHYTYSDTEGDIEGGSVYQWYSAENLSGLNETVIGNSISYQLTNDEIDKFIRFSVTPVAATGNTTPGIMVVSDPRIGPVTNEAPVATMGVISGPGTFNVNDVLTGNYDYSDAEGDIEDNSLYEWWRSPDSDILNAEEIGDTGISYKITLSDTGKYIFFKVTPIAKSGNISGSQVESSGVGPVNTPPYAESVTIAGTVAVGSTLRGRYVYHDGDKDAEGTTTFRWLRNGTNPIPGATDSTYLLLSNDEGFTITFEVTPVSSVGYPDRGAPVKSPATIPVIYPSVGNPVASEVCIEGTRVTGQVLKGYYKYTFSKEEGVSIYKWLRDDVPIPGKNGLSYTLSDNDFGKKITFEVTPVSSNHTPKIGTSVKSDPLAMIILQADSYSLGDTPDTLKANVPNGIFSGPGVSNGVFSPQLAGSAGSPHTIIYALNISNPGKSCSQTAYDTVTVSPINSYFSGFNNVYCHGQGKDTITVENIPPTASPVTFIFRLTNEAGRVELLPDRKSIVIDPGLMRPGNKTDTLFFSYIDKGSLFPIFRPFVIDSVGTKIAMVNLDSAYCQGSVKRYVTIEGTYPGGGNGTWTGAIMTDKATTSAFVDPSSGAPGTTYPVTYQYTSPLQCRSKVLNIPVTINTLPDPSFALDATYNYEGGAKVLTSTTAGGNFVGPGVIGNMFYPDIAGQGVHEIKYYLTDSNNCSNDTSITTIVRKGLGIYNDLPSIICYRDTTYNISVTGLPAGITIRSFLNTKKSLVHSPGSALALYSVTDAGAGYDTVRFSYTWDKVDYTLIKTLFIDSIGKVAITGLKDNYCDYDGTMSLRVFVENSAGSGNFAFSGPDSSFTNYGNIADFYPSKTPTSSTPYKVSYTHVSAVNNSGCRKKAENDVTVNKAPAVNIIRTRTTVNYEEPPILLTGVPVKGLFSGKGVYKQGDDYVFNPLVAGLGDIEISLSYVDSTGCFNSDRDTLNVTLATGIIEGIDASAQYCFDGPGDTLTYNSSLPWLSGSFVGPGITNISSTKSIFTPGIAGKGEHRILFKYFDLRGTEFNVPAILKVDEIGQVSINNLNAGDIFCNNDAAVQLFASHPGGIFSGPVNGSMFDPSKEVGNTSVGFTYTNPKTGCFSSVSVPIIINPAPAISFSPVDLCIEGSSDSTKFINTTSSSDQITEWSWEFTEFGGSSKSNLKEPQYLYKAGGLHKVTLKATTVKNCIASRDVTIDLGVKPIADFYWKNECYHPNDSIMFIDTTISSSLIIGQSWNFFDGKAPITIENPKYPQRTTGYIPVEYTVKTSYPGCDDKIFKNVYIRPTFKLTEDDYFENFETGKGGWVKDYESVNSWTFGKPGRLVINSAASGDSAWYTGYSLTSQKIESSSVISPCFDFGNVKRPMIRLKLWKRFDRDRDGATLQYKVGDTLAWQHVGSLDDGINWFNSAVIKGRPGGNQIGWTTKGSPDTKWIESRHTIDELQGKKDVKFRIAYGSDGTSQDNDGIAFDDIRIGERTRKVLLEHFTNTKSTENSEATELVNTISQHNTKDIINIQYHTNFPGSDPYYDDNPGDASARILYYGLIKTPYTFIDGGNRKDYANLFDYVIAGIDSNDVSRRSLINPSFRISLNSNVTGGVLTVNGTITALTDINSENITLYLAVTEKKNNDNTGANGEKVFYNVFRKFIPDAGGTSLNKTWKNGDLFNLPQMTWVIENIKYSSDIEVVAFIQNNITKEIFQAGSDTNHVNTVGIDDIFGKNGKGFALYPVPAVNNLTITFEEPLLRNADIRIYDLRGIVMSLYKAASGTSEYIIGDLNLSKGIYLVRVSSAGTDLGFKKLIVSGD